LIGGEVRSNWLLKDEGLNFFLSCDVMVAWGSEVLRWTLNVAVSYPCWECVVINLHSQWPLPFLVNWIDPPAFLLTFGTFQDFWALTLHKLTLTMNLFHFETDSKFGELMACFFKLFSFMSYSTSKIATSLLHLMSEI
jgi:hypothetical protein